MKKMLVLLALVIAVRRFLPEELRNKVKSTMMGGVMAHMPEN